VTGDLREATWLAWFAARVQARDAMRHQLMLISAVVQPVVLTLFVVAPLPASERTHALARAVAVLLVTLWSTAVWLAGNVLQEERFQGTLPANLIGARSGLVVFFGKTAGASAVGTLITACSTVLTAFALGVRASPVQVLLLLPVLVLAAATICVAGFALACLFLLTRFGGQIGGALIYPMFVFGGVLVPRDRLPSGIDLIPLANGLHWLQRFVISAVSGTPMSGYLAVAVALLAVYAAVTAYAYRRIVAYAHRTGSFDLV